MSNILVIDDDGDFYRLFLDRYLTMLGFSAFGVTTGDEGLEFSKTIKPDLILLDWCLKKGLSGEKTLARFKSQPATKNIPVVVMSALKNDPEDELRARRAGAVQFISKFEISNAPRDKNVFQRRLQSQILDRKIETPVPRRVAEKLVPLANGGGRILIIDDDPDVCDMVSLLLTQKGYSTTAADRGALGLGKAQRELPDLVILDLSLPDMDGLEVCAQLKNSPRTRPIPVLILTGQASTQAQQLAIEYSADHYFSKPIPDLDEFHGWIAAFLRRQSHLGGAKLIRVGGDFVIDIEAHTLTVNGRLIENTPNILFRLLCEFARRPWEVLEKDYLVRRVWNNRVREHNVETVVSRLKQFLGEAAKDWFVAVPGKGYRMFPFPSANREGSNL